MTSTSTTALPTVSLGALLVTPMTPRQWQLAPWLREQESALIWAAPGVGKTMTAPICASNLHPASGEGDGRV